MKTKLAFCIAAVLLATGCADQPGATAHANARPPAEAAKGGAAPPGDVVKAVSPFGSREPAAPARHGVTIPQGTTLRVRLLDTVDTRTTHPGDRITATLDTPVLNGAHVVIPKGAIFTGHVSAAKRAGRLRGRAVLGLRLDLLELNGKTYSIVTSAVNRTSADHKQRNLGFIGGGSGLGAAIGALAGGVKGAFIGAGAGAAAGTAGAAATGRRDLRLPAETRLTFSLERPVTI